MMAIKRYNLGLEFEVFQYDGHLDPELFRVGDVLNFNLDFIKEKVLRIQDDTLTTVYENNKFVWVFDYDINQLGYLDLRRNVSRTIDKESINGKEYLSFLSGENN